MLGLRVFERCCGLKSALRLGLLAQEQFESGDDKHGGEQAAHCNWCQPAAAEFRADDAADKRGGDPVENTGRDGTKRAPVLVILLAEQSRSRIDQDESRRDARCLPHVSPAKEQYQWTQKNPTADADES